MNILIDINHPAHVHLFKNLIKELELTNTIYVTALNKEITKFLLNKYNIHITKLFIYPKNILSKYFFSVYKIFELSKIVIKKKIDLLIGVSFFNSVAGWLTKTESWMFDDTEHAKNYIIYKPFATKIFTPDCFLLDLGPKQVRYPGYHELAYLHPNRFKPNPEVLKEIGLTESDKFFVLRFVGWEASHDIGQKGLSLEDKRNLVETLKPYGKIIISSEKELPAEFEEYRMPICPTKMHDLLYYATMYIGESGTMATEASLVGTPSILITSLAKFCGNHISLQNAELQFFFDNYIQAINLIKELLKDKNIKENWKYKLNKFLEKKIDVTEFIIESIENVQTT